MLTGTPDHTLAAFANHRKAQYAGRLKLCQGFYGLPAHHARKGQPYDQPSSPSHSASITNSNVARPIMVSGASVSRIGRTSSADGQSSFGFLIGSPLKTGSDAKYICVTSGLCPGAFTRK